MRATIHLKVSKDVRRMVKAAAAMQGVSMNDFVVVAITRLVKELDNAEKCE